MAPVEDIVARHGLNAVFYADDSQLYVACDSREDLSTTGRIEACVDEIRQWMRFNLLSLNDEKTEIVRFSSRTKRMSVTGNVRVGEVHVSPSAIVRDLGVMLDSAGLMDEQIKSVCSKASHSLWRIGKIRHLLDRTSTEKLIHGFVTSRLDYCNSLLYGLPQYKIKKLQHVQNAAARLVVRTKVERHANTMPILKELHWLPVEQRIHFKILCIIFKLIRHVDSAPSYLTDIVQVCTPSYRTRSCREVILAPFSYKSHGKMTSNQYGDRALSVVAPDLWNNLPSNLRSLTQFNQFKSHLKTYLFKQHFS